MEFPLDLFPELGLPNLNCLVLIVFHLLFGLVFHEFGRSTCQLGVEHCIGEAQMQFIEPSSVSWGDGR